MVSNIDKFIESVKEAKDILVIQAENPDGDSLATSLALEAIFTDLGKETSLHCSVTVPEHLKHLPGWDRVSPEMPQKIDLAIIVDASRQSLLQRSLEIAAGRLDKVNVFILDHHDSENDIELDSTDVVDVDSVATGELIYQIAKKGEWPINQTAANMIVSSILYDSLGMMTDKTTATSIRTVADLVEQGVSLAELDAKRREYMTRDADITKYKGELITRIEYALDGQLGYVTIPWEEIEQYSSRYNPAMLVIDDIRLTKGVKLAMVFKTYPDGKLTAKLRANYGYPVAKGLAESFGGGGHPYAAGFKLEPGDLNETIEKTIKYLDENLEDAAD